MDMEHTLKNIKANFESIIAAEAAEQRDDSYVMQVAQAGLRHVEEALSINNATVNVLHNIDAGLDT